ncbi:hypothetical protein [Allokutzneria oryzae]|uniref:PE domain-containing protein n=1 Tax=Allokutzneria oryzae TaxID=1378989 RepID=A0ABV6A5A3_9PSEU
MHRYREPAHSLPTFVTLLSGAERRGGVFTMSKGYVRVGGWRIDLDKIPAAIKIFTEARNDVQNLASRGVAAGEIRPMGLDDVSLELVKELNQRYFAGTGTTSWAIGRFRDEMNSVVAQLEAVRRHYRRVEDSNHRNLRGA